MFPPEEMDKPFAYEDADNERHHARYDSAEGDVLEESCARNLIEKIEKIV